MINRGSNCKKQAKATIPPPRDGRLRIFKPSVASLLKLVLIAKVIASMVRLIPSTIIYRLAGRMQIGKRLRVEWVELGERSDDHSRKHHESPKQSISSPAATTESMKMVFKGSTKNHITNSMKFKKETTT